MTFSDQEEDSQKNNEGKLIGDSSDIVSSISKFFNNDEMSDITLKVGHQLFHAHRFVLVLMSDVFRVLCSQRWNSSTLKEIELAETEECARVFPIFLHFLYHGSVHVNDSTALPLLMLGDKYDVKPLKKSCEEYVQSQVDDGNVLAALKWLPYLVLYGHEGLEKSCKEVIILDMDFVIKCSDFINLNIQFLIDILTRDDLVVSSEHYLYLGVQQWLVSRKPNVVLSSFDDSNKSEIESLIPLIRFSMMTSKQLMMIEKSEFYEKFHDIMQPCINSAHRYRSIACEITDPSFYCSKYRPRNYTDDNWCLSFNIASNGNSVHPNRIGSFIANDIVSTKCICPKINSMSAGSNWEFFIVVGDQCELPVKAYERWRPNLAADPNFFSHESVSKSTPRPSSSFLGLRKNKRHKISSEDPEMVPLYINVRPTKPLRCNTVVDVSLFLVRKNKICRLLDTKTVLGPVDFRFYEKNSPKTLSTMWPMSYPNKGPLASIPKTPRVFHPTPMHFSFIQPSSPPPEEFREDNSVLLEYLLPKEWFILPPEVPYVSFPRFAPCKPTQGMLCIAIICKPRLRCPDDTIDEELSSEKD